MSRIRADQLVNRVGSGGPKFPNGVADGFSVSGVVTATSFRGDGSQLTGIDASSLKDGSNVKVQAHSTGATITGNVAATGNVTAVDGTFSGNATVQGNLTVNGTTTTIDTAVTAVDSLAVEGNVGIGTTVPTHLLHLHAGAASQILLERSGSNPSKSFIKNEGELLEFSQNTDGIIFKTGGSPSERLRVTSAGRVGVGSQSPNSILDAYAGDGISISNNGDTFLQNRTLNDTGTNYLEFKDSAGGSGAISYHHNGNSLRFKVDGAERIRITSSGHILPGADNTQDLGSSSKRFANLYTGDLNLSNEGSANDVDGTWGQYTIQEGEDDLFLINRRTGKKYKFNLTEVN